MMAAGDIQDSNLFSYAQKEPRYTEIKKSRLYGWILLSGRRYWWLCKQLPEERNGLVKAVKYPQLYLHFEYLQANQIYVSFVMKRLYTTPNSMLRSVGGQ